MTSFTMPSTNKHAPGNPFVEHAPGNPFVEPSPTTRDAFFDAAARTTANNLLALPQGIGTAIAAGAAGLRAPGEITFSEAFEEEKGKFPASLIRKIPAPTVGDIGAGIRSIPALLPGGETPGERFSDELASGKEELAAMQQQFPTATALGDVTGDVATIVGGRLPFARRVNKFEDFLTKARLPKITDPSIRREVIKALESKAFRSILKGTGRSVETGLEAMSLDILKGDDPLETAFWAAGSQAGGSLSLQTLKGAKNHPIIAGAIVFGAAYQIGKELVPGGNDNLIESMTTGFEKMAGAIVLGTLAGVAGTGRVRGRAISESMPRLTDAITSIPRAAMISFLEDLVDAPPQTKQEIALVTSKLAQDPQFFGAQATAQLQSAMQTGKLIEGINELKQSSEEFTKKLFSLAPPQHLFPEQRQ